MTPYESDATKGTAAQSLAERAVSVVETRTRSQPLVEMSGVCLTLEGRHVRDPDTSPSQAIRMAVRAGDLVALTPPDADREYLGLPSPAVFRCAFENPTAEKVRAAIQEEAEGRARRAWIGALNELKAELQS